MGLGFLDFILWSYIEGIIIQILCFIRESQRIYLLSLGRKADLSRLSFVTSEEIIFCPRISFCLHIIFKIEIDHSKAHRF